MKLSFSVPGSSLQSSGGIARGIVAAVALSVSACMTTQNTQTGHIENPQQTTGVAEGDIDNLVFIALVGISAEIQAGIDFNPENRSLQFVWEKVGERLGAMDFKQPISVSLCSPVQTERGWAYIIIDVAGQQTQIFSKDKKDADNISKQMQEFYIDHTTDRIGILLGDRPATIENLQAILEDEENNLRKHGMAIIIEEDTQNSWTISFESDI